MKNFIFMLLASSLLVILSGCEVFVKPEKIAEKPPVFMEGTVSTPVIGPEFNTFITDQHITISTETSDADIIYTTDGSTPTKENGTVYNGIINITGTTVIKAIACKKGWNNSNVTAMTYTKSGFVETFNATANANVFSSKNERISLTDTNGYKHYLILRKTISVIDPTDFSYHLDFLINDNITAYPDETPGVVHSQLFFDNSTDIWDISTTYIQANFEKGATSTLDGKPRTFTYYISNSNMENLSNYSKIRVWLNITNLVYFECYLQDVESFKSLLNKLLLLGGTTPQADTPVFNHNSGTYSENQSITISTATSGATIRYTTDGTDPTSSTGNEYSSSVPIMVSETTTIKAIAYKDGWALSDVASVTYTIEKIRQLADENNCHVYSTENRDIVLKNSDGRNHYLVIKKYKGINDGSVSYKTELYLNDYGTYEYPDSSSKLTFSYGTQVINIPFINANYSAGSWPSGAKILSFDISNEQIINLAASSSIQVRATMGRSSTFDLMIQDETLFKLILSDILNI
jgi:hypothetical protein